MGTHLGLEHGVEAAHLLRGPGYLLLGEQVVHLRGGSQPKMRTHAHLRNATAVKGQQWMHEMATASNSRDDAVAATPTTPGTPTPTLFKRND